MLDPSHNWSSEDLDRRLSDEHGFSARFVGALALEHAEFGASWVRTRALDPARNEKVRANLGCSLAKAGMVDAEVADEMARLVHASTDPWTRLFALEALAGEWGTPHVDTIIKALDDRVVLGSLWAIYRPSDFALLALTKISNERAQSQARRAIEWLEEDISSDDEVLGAISVFALVRIGHLEARKRLPMLVNGAFTEQAEDLIEELTRAEGSAGGSSE